MYSFAALVRAQLPGLRDVPDPPGATGLALTGHDYEALVDALTEDRLDAWLVAMRERGAQEADRHGTVEDLIAETLGFCHRLRDCLGEDMPGGVPDEPQLAGDLQRLETGLLTALLAGYAAARERDLAEQKAKADIANALHEINSAANSTLDLPTVLDKTVQAVENVGAADVCSIFTYEPEIDRLVLRATCGLSPSAVGKVQLRRGEGFTGAAAELGRPIAVRDARGDPRNLYLPMLREEDCRSLLAVPIVLFIAEHKLLGVIAVESRVEREFGQREISFLETVAGEIAIAIENARLYQQTDHRLRQKVSELEMLQGFSATIAETLDLGKVLNLLASQAAVLVEADAAAVYELQHGALQPVAVYHFEGARRGEPLILAAAERPAGKNPGEFPTLRVDGSGLGRAMLLDRPLSLQRVSGGDGRDSWQAEDARDDLAGITGDPALSPLDYRSVFCVPLSAPRGNVGAICLYSRAARTLNAEQVALLQAFAREGAIAVENARLYQAALHGLEVKTWLMQEMNHRVRNNLARAVSLLQMQQRRLGEDSPAGQALADSIVRMQSIARVHDLLSREELGVTSLADLVQLAHEVVTNTLGRPDLRLQWQIDVEAIPITSATAFPLLLALVELLSNTLIHGFAGREAGRIRVSGRRDADRVCLQIQDDGAGLPPGFSLTASANLGLLIVQLLIQSELKGAIRLEDAPEGGVQTTIAFTPRSGDGEADYGGPARVTIPSTNQPAGDTSVPALR